MDQQLILYLHILSVSVALILLFVTFKWPNVGRLLFVMLFLWASYINMKTAITDPADYLNYASFAWWDLYRDFINGFFARHTTLIVILIACGQLTIAILLATKRHLVKWAGWGAIIFFLAIAPLGVGSGFPTTLIMVAGMLLVIRNSFDRNLLEVARNKNATASKLNSKQDIIW